MSHFDYAGPLVEFLLLANVATLFGQTLEFDPLGCKIVNHPEADAQYLHDTVLTRVDGPSV